MSEKEDRVSEEVLNKGFARTFLRHLLNLGYWPASGDIARLQALVLAVLTVGGFWLLRSLWMLL